MISPRKLVAGALALTMLGAFCFPAEFAGCKSSIEVEAVDDGNDDWLHAEGDVLCDKYGNEVWLTGANWFGFNCSECFPHGLWSCDLSDTIKACADHGINLLRIPVSTEILYTWMIDKPAECVGLNPSMSPYSTRNPELCIDDGSENGIPMDSLGVFDVLLKCCKEYGVKVMVDVHSPDANNSGHNYELWYGKEFAGITEDTAGIMCTTDIWMDTWCWLVERYKNDDTLIAVDLKNEPHGKRGYDAAVPSLLARWDDSTAENNWKYAAETCANRILEINPNILIVVEGNEQTPAGNLTTADPDVWGAASGQYWWFAWWGGNLRGVRKYPINLGANQDQLVYSPHDYGPSVYQQTWFDKDFTTQTLLDDYWYDTWAYIDAEGIAPLLIGEWGGHMDGGKNQQWMTLLRDYMTENHINHTFWCINPNSGDTGGLLSYDFVTWDEEKYGLLEESLWQTSSGQYISADHITPLGDNGLSLSEYYNLPNEPDEPDIPDLPTVTLWGDANCDGIVDVRDVALSAKYVAGATTAINEIGLLNLDVKAGNGINIQDVALVAKLAGKLLLQSDMPK